MGSGVITGRTGEGARHPAHKNTRKFTTTLRAHTHAYVSVRTRTHLLESVKVQLPHEALETAVPEVAGQYFSLQAGRVAHLEGYAVWMERGAKREGLARTGAMGCFDGADKRTFSEADDGGALVHDHAVQL